jgi:hypothetical protein
MADGKDIEQKVKVTFETNADQVTQQTDKVATAQDNVIKKQKESKKETQETSEATKGLTKTLDEMGGGALSSFKSLVGGIKSAAMGFRTLAGAIAMTGIGLLVIAVGALTAAFTSSEGGQDKFAKIMGVIGSVVGNVVDVIADLGEIIIGVLSGDSKAIKSATDFGKKIWDVVGLPIKNIIEIVKTAGKVLGSLFSGDVKGAIDNLKEGVNGVKQNFKDAGAAINDAKNALKEFGEEAIREAKIAGQIADSRAKADKLELGLITEKAEAERKRAELLEKAVQKDKFTQAERTKFLKEAGKLDEEITNKQIAMAKLRADALAKENTLSKTNKEAAKAEAEAKAEVIRLEAERLKRQKEVTSQIQGLINEETATAKAAAAERKALLDKQKAEREAFLKSIQDLENQYTKSIEDLRDKTEEERLARQKERDLQEIELLRQKGADVTELLKLNTEKYNILEDELREKRAEEVRIKDEELAKQKEEEDKARLEKEKEIELAALEHKRFIEDEKLNLAGKATATAKMLFEKNKGVQRAALIAENAIGLATVGINTARGISTAMAKGAPGIPEAVIVGASGALSAINIIAATAKGLKALGGGGSAGSASGNTQQMPSGGNAPQVDFQSSSENQIATTIATNTNDAPPVQAYVVSSEVTTAQALDRNRIDGNSF